MSGRFGGVERIIFEAVCEILCEFVFVGDGQHVVKDRGTIHQDGLDCVLVE